MQLKKGMHISCVISLTNVSEATIQEENGKVYICQDVKMGASCRDTLGYKYSWSIGNGGDKAQRFYGVNFVTVLPSDNVVDYMKLMLPAGKERT